jgi:hypothetical protein
MSGQTLCDQSCTWPYYNTNSQADRCWQDFYSIEKIRDESIPSALQCSKAPSRVQIPKHHQTIEKGTFHTAPYLSLASIGNRDVSQ